MPQWFFGSHNEVFSTRKCSPYWVRRSRLAGAGGSPALQVPQDLTPKERLVLAAIVKGLSSKEVARELGISPRTVEFHRSNLLKKCGAKNTAELVRKTSSTASNKSPEEKGLALGQDHCQDPWSPQFQSASLLARARASGARISTISICTSRPSGPLRFLSCVGESAQREAGGQMRQTTCGYFRARPSSW